MEDRIVIKGEMKGSKSHFRIEKSKKTKIDCVDFILRKIKRKIKFSK